MNVLYICYQSLFDPLTQTQVVAYLEGLATREKPIVLLTFEPTEPSATEAEAWESRLLRRHIVWRRLKYHKRPTLPATMWDILVGTFAASRLIRQFDISLVHARSHVPAVMGLLLKRLTGVPLLFDVRGLLAEEYVDAGVWPADGRLFRLTKRAERRLAAAADAFVVLTSRAEELLRLWYPNEMRGKTVTVIPCCADLSQWPIVQPEEMEVADTNLVEPKSRRLVYAGKLGGWYLTEEMIAFVSVATRIIPNVQWQVWTQSEHRQFQDLVNKAGLPEQVSLSRTTPAELAIHLRACDAGLAFIQPCLSKQASSPTKVGEYLAAGLPVVSFAGVGDLDDVLSGKFSDDENPVGVLIRERSIVAYEQACLELRELWRDPRTPLRCQRVARRLFDLKTVGWSRYRRVYDNLQPSQLHETRSAGEAASTLMDRHHQPVIDDRIPELTPHIQS